LPQPDLIKKDAVLLFHLPSLEVKRKQTTTGY